MSSASAPPLPGTPSTGFRTASRAGRSPVPGHKSTVRVERQVGDRPVEGFAPEFFEAWRRPLTRLRERGRFVGDRDLVFCDPLGRHLGYKTLRARYKAALRRAGLRDLRFHDLRHTFGTHAIRAADPREVMEWVGHADIQTTQKYLAYRPRRDAARRLAGAFKAYGPPPAGA